MNDLDVLGHGQTDAGLIYLSRREIPGRADPVYQIDIDGALLMSSVDPVSERRLASSALAMHRGVAPLTVLVGGLGLGYTGQAALEDSRVGSVRVVEKMDFVADWMRNGLLPISGELNADDRMQIAQGDVYADLLGPPTDTYDLILVDVDHSPRSRLIPSSAPFYTEAGQKRVARHLKPGGVLAVWSAFDDDDFAGVLDGVFPVARRESVVWADVENPENKFNNTLFLAGLAA